jgi:hypothetical protein
MSSELQKIEDAVKVERPIVLFPEAVEEARQVLVKMFKDPEYQAFPVRDIFQQGLELIIKKYLEVAPPNPFDFPLLIAIGTLMERIKNGEGTGFKLGWRNGEGDFEIIVKVKPDEKTNNKG